MNSSIRVISSTPSVGRPASRRATAESDVLRALGESLDAADPRTAVRRRLTLKEGVLRIGSLSFDLSRTRRVLVIGGGKASGKMAQEIEKILGARITGGVVNVPDYQRERLCCRLIEFQGATHPIPGVQALRGVEKMLKLVGQPTRADLVICLISGGGSALMEMPAAGLSLKDIQSTTELLLKSGAEIDEMNAVRKHLSAVKGGRLAEELRPAAVLSLIMSDVVGDRLDSIASGPTAPDSTTYKEAEAVLRKYSIWNRVPRRVRETVAEGVAGKLDETPKEGANAFRRVSNVIVGSNRIACEAAAQSLRRSGYATLVLSTRIRGEAKETGRLLAGILSDMAENGLPLRPPAAVVAGGETTVTIRGRGVGGRNQELALSAAMEIEGLADAYVASMGTDGVDGPTDAAGALVDGTTVSRAKKVGLDPRHFLRDNDSNTFFRKVGGLLVTGPTGTNVNDIMIAVAGPGSTSDAVRRDDRPPP